MLQYTPSAPAAPHFPGTCRCHVSGLKGTFSWAWSAGPTGWNAEPAPAGPPVLLLTPQDQDSPRLHLQPPHHPSTRPPGPLPHLKLLEAPPLPRANPPELPHHSQEPLPRAFEPLLSQRSSATYSLSPLPCIPHPSLDTPAPSHLSAFRPALAWNALYCLCTLHPLCPLLPALQDSITQRGWAGRRDPPNGRTDGAGIRRCGVGTTKAHTRRQGAKNTYLQGGYQLGPSVFWWSAIKIPRQEVAACHNPRNRLIQFCAHKVQKMKRKKRIRSTISLLKVTPYPIHAATETRSLKAMLDPHLPPHHSALHMRPAG